MDNNLLFAYFLSFLLCAQCFPSGPPVNLCLAPYPHHSNRGVTISSQPIGNSPYSITLSQNTYGNSNNSMINVTIISSDASKNFKGILLTFKQNTSEIALPVGQFQSCDADGLKFFTVQGNTNSCLVHSNSKRKPSTVTCIYRAPFNNLGSLRMSAVIVMDYSTFWTRLEQTVSYVGTNQLQNIQNSTSISMTDVTELNCGLTKNCLLFPNLCSATNNCEYMVSYKTSGNNVDFELIGPGTGYLALGLSFDRTMNDDLVIGCSMDPDTKIPQIQTGYTTITGTSKLLNYNVNGNIVNRRSSRFSNMNQKSIMTCSFTLPRLANYPTTVPYPTDLSQSLVIFLANGDLYPNTSFIKKHVEAPLILVTTAVLYTDNILPNRYFSGLYYPRQVHGTLMTVAFIILLPMAVMIARHFRYNFKVEVRGKQLWFHLHILCNILFFVLAFSGYFYIISKVDKNWNPASRIHGGVGTVVMILALINIIMGFARPDIGTSTRIYFYWLHLMNATLIRLLAFVTFWLVFFTLAVRSSFKNWMMIVVIIWTGVEIIISVVFAILRSVRGKKAIEKKYELNDKPIHDAFNDHVGIIGMVFYILFVVSIALALLCGLWLN